jgi:hypothetical protein
MMVTELGLGKLSLGDSVNDAARAKLHSTLADPAFLFQTDFFS